MNAILQLPATEVLASIRRREVTARHLCEVTLEWIEASEPKLSAFLTLEGEQALDRAMKIDARLARNEEVGPLAGLPVAVKDNMAQRGIRMTCGSRILEHYISPFDATAVSKLETSGAVILGKTNMDEFAMGSSTENSAFQTTHNPWDLERVPGGSSGGSAVAVASGQAFLSLGSDTGGSIRQPASFCGVVGMKPTYGRISRYGLVAFASSLDQIGAFARNVPDLALAIRSISGHDPLDSTSLAEPVPDYPASLSKSPERLRIGVARDLLEKEGVAPIVRQTFQEALCALEALGYVLEDVSLPHADYGLPTYYLVAPAECSANLARFDGVRYGLRAEGKDLIDQYAKTRAAGFGPEVKRRVMVGTYALSAGYHDAFYLKSQKVRTLIRQDFDQAFREVDLIALPTSPTLPFRIGERVDDPLAMYMADLFTIPVSLAGLPALSLPIGWVSPEKGAPPLPVGLQLIGPVLAEERVLQAAFRFEEKSGLHDLVPPFVREPENDPHA